MLKKLVNVGLFWHGISKYQIPLRDSLFLQNRPSPSQNEGLSGGRKLFKSYRRAIFLFIFCSLSFVPFLGAEEGYFKMFPVYTDARSPDNHYIPSGYMGDYNDIKIRQSWMENPRSGTTSIRIEYLPRVSQGARWVGVYWQNPANNWGEREGGFDLSGATKLTFWARGETGEERIEEFKMGGLTGEYPDSDTAGIGPVILTREWKQYRINLEGKDLFYISGGFAWATNLDVNPEGCVFYLDDIRYE